MDLLDGIEDVNWDEWEHAYGPATDFPELARQLLEPELAKNAQYELYGNIFHQGTVYPATKHAIPWLIKLLVPESRADRAWLLGYLLDLAWGNSYMRQHAHLDDDGSPEYAARMAEEVSHVDGAREAVVAGFPVYLQILDEGDVTTSAAALDLMVGVPELVSKLRSEAWPKIQSLLNHEDVRLRAKAVMGLGWFPEYDAVKDELRTAFADESTSVQWAAAWSSGYHNQFSSETVSLLVGAMLEPEGIDAELKEVLGKSAGQTSIAPLLSAPVEFHQEIVDGMEVQLGRAESIDATEAARLMMLLVFGRVPAPTSLADFSPMQARVLQSVADCDEAWVFDGNMSQLLNSWGLPSKRSDLRAFLKPSTN